jgi:hypothetical protein
MTHHRFISNIFVIMMTIQSCIAFAPSATIFTRSKMSKSLLGGQATSTSSSFSLSLAPPSTLPDELLLLSTSSLSSPLTTTTGSHLNTLSIAATTVDPTTALSQVLGGLLGSPAILLIPVLAAFTVASAIAWFIVSYANPADPDDD